MKLPSLKKPVEDEIDEGWISVGEEKWNPEEDNILVGTLTDKIECIGPYDSSLYKIKTDLKVFFIWGTKILDSCMSSCDVGDLVQIEFKGTKKTSEDYSVKYYEVKKKIE